MIIGIAPIGILGLVFHSSVATTGIAGLAKYGQLLLLLNWYDGREVCF